MSLSERGKAVRRVSSVEGASHVAVEARREAGGAAVCMRWRFEEPNVDVSVTVSVGAKGGEARWSLRATSHGVIGVDEIEFPLIPGIAPAAGERDYLAVPTKIGWLVANPSVNANVGTELNMQFFGYTTGAGRGLYVSPEDSTGAPKQGKAASQDGALALSFLLPMPDPGAGRRTRAASAVTEVFHGDWYDACFRYRRWALRQSWVPADPLWKRQDTPRWLKECCVSLRNSASSEEQAVAQSAKARELRAFFGGPCLDIWYEAMPTGGAAASACARAPEWADVVFPRMRDLIADGKREGLHPTLYSLLCMWDTRLPSWEKEGKRHVQLEADGAIHWGRYGGEPLAYVCPAQAEYRRVIAESVARLARDFGADGTFADLSGTFTSEACFNPAHGHPLGASPVLWQGARDALQAMRREARKHNPDFVILSENPDERLLDAYDAYLTYQGLDLKTTRNIPMFQAVYGEYARGYGAKSGGMMAAPVEAANLIQLLAWGGMIGRVFVPATGEALSEEHKQRLKLERELAQWRRAALPYLGLGTMLRPPAVALDAPSGLARDPAMDYAVEAAAWRAPDGSVAFVFGNTRAARSIRASYTIAPRDYSIPVDGSWTLGEMARDGAVCGGQAITGPVRSSRDLSGSGVLILVAAPASGEKR